MGRLRKVYDFFCIAFFAEIECPATESFHVQIGGGVIWFDDWSPPVTPRLEAPAETGNSEPFASAVI
ncbi:Putative uncharacterized protein (plasmid) [Mesorhizobium loti]|nr:Putative uncharacterized protein [Mesorhizobium loti]